MTIHDLIETMTHSPVTGTVDQRISIKVARLNEEEAKVLLIEATSLLTALINVISVITQTDKLHTLDKLQQLTTEDNPC